MVENPDQRAENINIWLPFLLAIVMAGGILIGTKLQKAPLIHITTEPSETETLEGSNGQIEELIRYIEARYVDEVNREELVEHAINSVLEQLDPHSNYISASQLKDVNEVLEGNFEGVGIEFLIVEDTILVVAPLSGGPSEAVGIMAGDKIVMIEDSIVAGKPIENQDVIKLLKGPKDSKVRVGIKRIGEKDLIEFVIKRDEIPINSVDVSYMLDNQTGYVKISRFSSTTYREFMEGVEDLVENQEMKHLVIDLRQNPGGYLKEATNMLSQLFDKKGELLVYTEGRSTNKNEYKSTGKPFFDIDNVSVLIDEGSASASEILAGAVQDLDRGLVIGRRSFGKGLVQEQYNLRDGAALRLTVARYFTPSGRSIQKPYGVNTDYDADVAKRFESGELVEGDSVLRGDSTIFYTSEGRLVFGGGGITPDIFVPIDTLLYDDYYISLRQYLPQFVYRYVENNRQDIPTEELKLFNSQFDVDDQLIEEYNDYAVSKGFKLDEEAFQKIKAPFKRLLKARIARQLFKEEGFFYIWNQDDPAVQEAIRLMKEQNPFSAINLNE